MFCRSTGSTNSTAMRNTSTSDSWDRDQGGHIMARAELPGFPRAGPRWPSTPLTQPAVQDVHSDRTVVDSIDSRTKAALTVTTMRSAVARREAVQWWVTRSDRDRSGIARRVKGMRGSALGCCRPCLAERHQSGRVVQLPACSGIRLDRPHPVLLCPSLTAVRHWTWHRRSGSGWGGQRGCGDPGTRRWRRRWVGRWSSRSS